MKMETLLSKVQARSLSLDEYFDAFANSGENSLRLNGLNLTAIPEQVYSFDSIETLHLCDNYLTDLDPRIYRLEKLRHLCLNNNRIASLPIGISLLEDLEILTLSDNEIATLPIDFSGLRNLTELRLANNSITSIPEDFNELQSLRRLWLSGNELRRLPVQFYSMSELEFLCLCDNEIDEIDDRIGELIQLRNLCFHNNNVNSIPDTFSSKSKLERLVFDENPITEIPLSIGKLRKLNTLQFDKDNLHNSSIFKIYGIGEIQKMFSQESKTGTIKKVLLIPEKWKVAFIQYISFFDEYVALTRGEQINISAKKVDVGIELSFENIDSLSTPELEVCFQEYFEHLMNSIRESSDKPFQITTSSGLNDNDLNYLIINLKSEIRSFRTRLEIAQERIYQLQQENSDYRQDLKEDRRILVRLLENTTKIPLQISRAEKQCESVPLQLDLTGLKRKLSTGRIQSVIDEILISLQDQNSEYANEIIMLSARLRNLDSQKNSGQLSLKEYNEQHAQLCDGVLQLINRLS